MQQRCRPLRNLKRLPKENDMKLTESNPNVLGGTKVIKNTRIPLKRIKALIKQGYTLKELKDDYPYLTLTSKQLANLT
jgi:uncharacterized protein (DUF433 family)